MEFYSFRGNISFIDQMSLFDLGIKNDSKTKNEIFRFFFTQLKENSKKESEYQKRIYYLIFIEEYDGVVHCQLARKRNYSKYEMTKERIIGIKDEDYPYVNIFIELNTQKIFIESNTQIFENYNTCKDVTQNIMNNYFKDRAVVIVLEAILKEEDFWSFFENGNKIYNLQFSLCVPNLFDAEDDATNLLRHVEKNVNANHVDLHFSNNKGNLKPNRIGIDSYVKYVSAGGGSWKITIEQANGKKKNFYSKQKSTKVIIPINSEKINNKLLTEEDHNNIKIILLSVETIEKFI